MERLYGEYNQKKTGFDERYGGLEHPEMYYGWKQRGDELAALEERYGKQALFPNCCGNAVLLDGVPAG